MPSVTETLSEWGLNPIACTRFCERPDLRHVGGTKDPDVDEIADLGPDLVILDKEENRREDYDALIARNIAVWVLHIQSLEDINPSMSALAERVDAQWIPLHLSETLSRRVNAFVPIWRKPWIALGAPTYGASLLARLGVVSIFTGQGPYPPVSLDTARRCQPDLVIAPSEPYPFTKRQLPELETIAPTVFIDGRDLFWWGHRTSGAILRLAEVLGSR